MLLVFIYLWLFSLLGYWNADRQDFVMCDSFMLWDAQDSVKLLILFLNLPYRYCSITMMTSGESNIFLVVIGFYLVIIVLRCCFIRIVMKIDFISLLFWAITDYVAQTPFHHKLLCYLFQTSDTQIQQYDFWLRYVYRWSMRYRVISHLIYWWIVCGFSPSGAYIASNSGWDVSCHGVLHSIYR